MSTLGLYFSVFPLSLDFWVLRILNFLGEPINALKKDVFSIPPRVFNFCGQSIVGRGRLGCFPLLWSALADRNFFLLALSYFPWQIDKSQCNIYIASVNVHMISSDYELFSTPFKCFFNFTICLSGTDLTWGCSRMCKWLLFELLGMPKYTILNGHFPVKLIYEQKSVLRNDGIWNKIWGKFHAYFYYGEQHPRLKHRLSLSIYRLP